MSPKRTFAEQVRERMLKFWEAEPEYGLPVGCVTTTYTFDAAFFEEECLSRFVGLENSPREDGRAYLIEREEKLSQITATVMVDTSHVTPQRSLRWDLIPVKVRGGGVMHAKVSLLVWEHLVRVLVSSANLTEPGYRRNYEHVGVLDFAQRSDIPVTVLQDVLAFLNALKELAPQQHESEPLGPQTSLARLLSAVAERARAMGDRDWGRRKASVEFIPVLPGQQQLFERLRELFPSNAGARDAWILSPFFDRDDGAKRVVEALVDTMGIHGERTLTFHVTGRELSDTDETVELDAPEVLRDPWRRRVTHSFHLVTERDESDEVRNLHAKSLWLERDGTALFLLGSSNFTAAGTGVSGRRGNIEANFAYVLPDASDSFAKRCVEVYPPAEPIDLDERVVSFLQQHEQTQEAEGYAPLPDAFGLALFKPEGENGILVLSISEGAPQAFDIRHPDVGTILSANTWIDGGSQTKVEIVWNLPRSPSHLDVMWTSSDGDQLKGIWVVNVTDGARLPPPDELRTLNLEELLEILTSARPLHQTIPRILRKREGKDSGATSPPLALDPHRKVDTRNFLLRRMRRVAAALEGLRERLERPAYNRVALSWRLSGPVGPVALAKKLAEAEPEAAGFLLAEVALTVFRADWSYVEKALGRTIVRREVKSVVNELEALARRTKAPPNLAGYVRDAFEEIRR